MDNKSLYKIAEEKLYEYQKGIIRECEKKKNGCLNVAMGGGKTIISICAGLLAMKEGEQMLVICSKTLIENWTSEIKKFFEDKLKYVILHKEYIKDFSNFSLDDDIKLIITTSEVTSKTYTELDINNDLIYYIIEERASICCYHKVEQPFRKITRGKGILYSKKWGYMVIDEAQNYNNIKTKKCRSLIAIDAKQKWCLSGTLFNAPKTENILGYYLLINDKDFPRNLPGAQKLLLNKSFEGFNKTLVVYNAKVTNIKIKEHTIINEFNKDEEKIYLSMKSIVKKLKHSLDKYKLAGDVVNIRKFNAYLLTMIIYLRQCIINPLLPIANIYLDIANFKEKEELSQIIMKEIKHLNIETFLNDEHNLISSRIRKVLDVIKTCSKKIVIFSSFRSNLDLLHHIIVSDLHRTVIIPNGSMSASKRKSLIDDFNNSNDSILLLTYSLGSEGLNIQTADTMLLLDFEWSNNKTNQAIARIVRTGQLSSIVNIYYFLSNSALEKAIFTKQKEKITALKELETGSVKTRVKSFTTNDIIKLISSEQNKSLLTGIRNLSL